MLIRVKDLERIKTGEISTAFRRWKRASVKQGGQLTTAVGMLAIESVDKVQESKITEAEAKAAGHTSLEHLLSELNKREGDTYQIGLRYLGEDPRIALRSDEDLSKAEIDDLIAKLNRMDARSSVGPWTRRTLHLIAEHPAVLAQKLADNLPMDKQQFKVNVRKLKKHGLTISLGTGYEISPRGKVLLKHL